MKGLYTIIRNTKTKEVVPVRVTNLFDCRGQEIDDAEGAYSFVCSLPDGQWLSGAVDDFTIYRMH